MAKKIDDLVLDNNALAVAFGFMLRGVRYVGNVSSNHYKSTKGNNHFGFIPSSIEGMLDPLHTIYRDMQERGINPYGTTFCDLGCGVGNIMAIARGFGFKAYGIEYNKDTYEIARKIHGDDRVFLGDIITTKLLKRFNIFYYYQPIADHHTMNTFTERLARLMNVGAYVIPNGSTNGFHQHEKYFETIQARYCRIFRKVKEIPKKYKKSGGSYNG